MLNSTVMEWQILLDAARLAHGHAYARYSGFSVGAALLTGDGSVFSGCNVENQCFGVTLCAERAALAAAVAQGHRQFRSLVILTEVTPPARPCGLCLQVLAEFCPDLNILLASLSGRQEEVTLLDLYPQPFNLPGDTQ